MPYNEAEIHKIVHERDVLARQNAVMRRRLQADLTLLAKVEQELNALKLALRLAIMLPPTPGTNPGRWHWRKQWRYARGYGASRLKTVMIILKNTIR